MTTRRPTRPAARGGASLPAKIAACGVVAVCVAAGAVGLVLPIIPGLLFLVIAAVIVVRTFPATAAWLRRHRTLGGYVDKGERVLDLPPRQQLKLAGLVCVKAVVDGAAFVGARLTKLVPARRSRSAGG